MKSILQFCLLICVFGLSAAAVMACTCGSPPMGTKEPDWIKEEVKTSKNVFSGRVVSIKNGGMLREQLVTLQLIEAWKGVNTKRRTVVVKNIDLCGYPFETGESYLVYASDFYTTFCTRTRRLTNAAADLAFLGAGTKATPAGRPRRRHY